VACDVQRVSGQTLRQCMAVQSFSMHFVHLLEETPVDRPHYKILLTIPSLGEFIYAEYKENRLLDDVQRDQWNNSSNYGCILYIV